MKRLVYALMPILAILASACDPYSSPENPGKLGMITVNATPIVQGQVVEFSVLQVEPSCGEVYDKSVTWSVNGNEFGIQKISSDEGVYQAIYTPQDTGTIIVHLKVTYQFSHVQGNTPSMQSVETTGEFNVIPSDVHQFRWGDSKEKVKKNLTSLRLVSETESVLLYAKPKEAYGDLGFWKTWGTDDLSSGYSFENNKLSGLTEFIMVNPKYSSKFYEEVSYHALYNHKNFTKKFQMGAVRAIWNVEPTQEEVAAAAIVGENYSASSKEQRALVGKCIAEGKLQLTANAPDTYKDQVVYLVKTIENSDVVYCYLQILPK